MAIAFARVSIHTRSKGHSAIAAASYRAGIKLKDDRTGLTHDFSNRDDVVFSKIYLPENASEQFLDRETLWNTVESVEKRKDAQLCKDVVLALPKELDKEMQIEIVDRFVQSQFVSNGLPADIAIHDHGDGNPHVHILIPTRRLEGHQFSKRKARDLNPTFAKGFIVEQDYWGEQWKEFQNTFFIEKNIDLQVDANHLISERHHGKYRGSDEHYLKQDNQLIKEARMEATRKNINLVLKHLYNQHSVFTRRDVEQFLFKTFAASEEPKEYLQFVEKVMGHTELIYLGENKKGQASFTTQQHFHEETKLLKNIEALQGSKKHITNYPVHDLSQKYNLSEEQHEAFKYITETSDISIVIGRPGTGKTYLLKPVKDYYEKVGFNIIGTSLSGKVAKALQSETGIPSSTIKSLQYRLSNNMLELSKNDVLVVDEAGMVDFSSMSFLINEVKKAGAKIILIGDPDQLKPIQKGEIFRGITEQTDYIELENIKRQQDPRDRKASLNMAKGNFDEAIQHYYGKGAIHFADNPDKARDAVIDNWKKDIEQTDIGDTIMLSYTRKAVNGLNDKARSALLAESKLGNENIEFQGFERKMKISRGERLLFRENDKELGLRNGDTATVISVTRKRIKAKLDSGESVKIPKEYNALDYAYALTVHKSQGMTAKRVNLLIDSKYWDRNLCFVGMTRHKESLNIYADKVNHPKKETLTQAISRKTIQENAFDMKLSFRNQDIKPPCELKINIAKIAELEKLMNKRELMSGYFAEKTDKKISTLLKEFFSDKVMAQRIKTIKPKLYEKLRCQENKIIEKFFER